MATAANIGKSLSPSLPNLCTESSQKQVVFGAGKKVKRTGKEALFSEQTGKLTDEASALCKVLGIEPKDIYPR